MVTTGNGAVSSTARVECMQSERKSRTGTERYRQRYSGAGILSVSEVMGRRFIVEGSDCLRRWGRWVADDDDSNSILAAGSSRSSLHGKWISSMRASIPQNRPSTANSVGFQPSSIHQRPATSDAPARPWADHLIQEHDYRTRISAKRLSTSSTEQLALIVGTSAKDLSPSASTSGLVLTRRLEPTTDELLPFQRQALSRSNSHASVQRELLSRGRYAGRLGRTSVASFGGRGPWGSF